MIRQSLTLALASLALGACMPEPLPPAPPPPRAPNTGDTPAPDTMRWLYGSGEAAAASIQAWRQLTDYALTTAAAHPRQSVRMGLPDSHAPAGAGTVGLVPCDNKPPAVVFDMDETAVLNSGYEYWQALSEKGYDADDWRRWANDGAPYVTPVPGAVEGVRRLREAGIAVVFNTNRSTENVAGTIAAIKAAGLGTAVHGETLFLKGDDAMGSRKDGRRATIASRYCVIALAGDNLGDFADVFNDPALPPLARRDMATEDRVAQLWGAGWFALPNPVYGAWQKGSIDETFPPETRWMPNNQPDRSLDIMNEGK